MLDDGEEFRVVTSCELQVSRKMMVKNSCNFGLVTCNCILKCAKPLLTNVFTADFDEQMGL